MGNAGESSVDNVSVVFPSDIANGGGDVGKRARVSSCGFGKGGTVKRVKKELFLPHNFLDPLPRPVVFAPTPLSIRPVMPFMPMRPAAPISMVRPATHPSTVSPLASHSITPPVASHSTIPPAAAPSAVRPVGSLLKTVKDGVKEEVNGCKQFWKAGDYEGTTESSSSFSAEIERVRVHPKFLHSNATSHKWALGALAELLDNSMDEVCNGATFVSIDVLENPKDKTKMLLVEDNGGGMDPDKMRQCMSLGYSVKSKSANTIGQYGNGFKTSTMRLGADVIVFSRCKGRDGTSPTQSIGILSYTFLRSTGKQDIIVPMVDYEKRGDDWHQIKRSSSDVWKMNMDTILQWSPYCSEADLLQQFNLMFDHGTRIVIYNLWEEDEGHLELDFVTDAQDIQIRGTSRDEKKIKMSEDFPNSRHFLTYHHSLRSYASILYLSLPEGFRMILRGKEIEHHNIVNDMMMQEEKTYRPQPGPDGVPKDPNIFAVVTIGFVKDATNHVDVQGFNVYHKNRLIKPFWRVWNAAGSDGRGVIGVLEANFIEPAHDKQGFERTTVLNRLEARLLHIQKTYWSSNCHMIGYAPRRHKKSISISEHKERSPEDPHQLPSTPLKDTTPNVVQSQDSKMHQCSHKHCLHLDAHDRGISIMSDEFRKKKPQRNGYEKSEEHVIYQQSRSEPSDTECGQLTRKSLDGSVAAASSSPLKDGLQHCHVFARTEMKSTSLISPCSKKTGADCHVNEHEHLGPGMRTNMWSDKNLAENERENIMKGQLLQDLHIEREKNKELIKKVEVLEKRLQDVEKEQEALVNVLFEERHRRDTELEEWVNKLEVANDAIKNLEKLATVGIKSEPRTW